MFNETWLCFKYLCDDTFMIKKNIFYCFIIDLKCENTNQNCNSYNTI